MISTGKLILCVSTMVSVFALVGCQADTAIGSVPPPDGGSGGADALPDVNPSVDAEAGVDGNHPACCPRDTTMSGCMHLGGSNVSAISCAEMCDFFCSTNWRVITDGNGCEEWKFDIVAQCMPPSAGNGGSPDAGHDAADAGHDAADAGHDAADAEVETGP